MNLHTSDVADLPVHLFDELLIRRSLVDIVHSRFKPTGAAHVLANGRSHSCIRGAWALWIPSLQVKFLNSIDGKLTCLSRKAPPRESLRGSDPIAGQWGRYPLEAWRQAYEKPVSRRVAENVVAAERLHKAGIGPRVLGLCVARRFRDGRRDDRSFAAGFRIENAALKPPRPAATQSQLIEAGVRPDQINSAVRQQVNGYVVDLNSVVGVVPVEAEAEVSAVEAQIAAAMSSNI
ncbi:MAG: hypothetical protein ACOC9Q_02510 [bacterium]